MKPTIAIVDFDYPIYFSASAAEQTWYVYYDQDYNEVARFKTADEGKSWLEMADILGGVDFTGDYQGDFSSLIRETEWEPKKFSIAQQTLRGMRDEWLGLSGCSEWKGKCAPKKGATVFRKEISTIMEYKGNRKNTRKPKHLDNLRKWALQDNLQLSKVLGPYETDDIVCAMGQKIGDKAVIVQEDKDVRTVSGCWFLIPSCMDQPIFSPSDVVGNVYVDNGKVKGYGDLYLLSMVLTGDTADNYSGCKGVGPKTAVNVLECFNDKPATSLKPAVQAVGELFRSKYGETYQYTHCTSGEPVTATFRDIMIENLRLAYMVKHKGDKPQEIIDYIKEM